MKKRIKLIISTLKNKNNTYLTDAFYFIRDYYDKGKTEIESKEYRNISIKKYMRVRVYKAKVVIGYSNFIRNTYLYQEGLRVYGIEPDTLEGWSDL